MRKRIPFTRILFDLVLLSSVFVFPFWGTVIIAFLGLVLFPFFAEFMIVFFVIELLYSGGSVFARMSDVRTVLPILSIAIFVLVHYTRAHVLERMKQI